MPAASDTGPRCPVGSIPAGAGCIDAKPVFIEKCPGVRKALRFYTKRWQHWTTLRTGAGREMKTRVATCPRYLLKIRKAKAAAAHREWDRWFAYHYAWSQWMDDKWQRIGACETGFGRRPGNFQWDSGAYVSAFGIIRSGYTYFAHEIGQLGWDETRSRLLRYPTPREQYNVALRIHYHYGFSGWGCRGA